MMKVLRRCGLEQGGVLLDDVLRNIKIGNTVNSVKFLFVQHGT